MKWQHPHPLMGRIMDLEAAMLEAIEAPTPEESRRLLRDALKGATKEEHQRIREGRL
jgi:hypothetical protein